MKRQKSCKFVKYEEREEQNADSHTSLPFVLPPQSREVSLLSALQ
jgi:hypothetical protein